MSHVFARSCHDALPRIAGGRGVHLYDTDGKAYLDASGGAAVSCLGHGDPDVIAAIKAQLDRVAFAHTGFFTSEPAEALADRLTAHAPPGIDRVYLVSGGSEAMEAALKLARQYFVEIGQPQRHRIVARRQSYHGNTLGALAAGGNLARRALYAPLLGEVHHVSPCYAYRGMRSDEDAGAYAARLAAELDAQIRRLGPDTVMAFVAETVVGATAGAVPPVADYFARIREVCDRHGVLLILDEVMCGMGRTGTLFASEQEGVAPDIVAVAKGLGAGYQPVGAMLCQGFIWEALAAGSGAFRHGHTYLGHPVAAAAALAVLTRLTDGGLVEQCRETGAILMAALRERFGDHPYVGDIRGRGLLIGLELVGDIETKQPLDTPRACAPALKRAAMEAGLICYPMDGTIDGERGTHILLAPPFVATRAHVGELVTKLSTVMESVL